MFAPFGISPATLSLQRPGPMLVATVLQRPRCGESVRRAYETSGELFWRLTSFGSMTIPLLMPAIPLSWRHVMARSVSWPTTRPLGYQSKLLVSGKEYIAPASCPLGMQLNFRFLSASQTCAARRGDTAVLQCPRPGLPPAPASGFHHSAQCAGESEQFDGVAAR